MASNVSKPLIMVHQLWWIVKVAYNQPRKVVGMDGASQLEQAVGICPSKAFTRHQVEGYQNERRGACMNDDGCKVWDRQLCCKVC